MKKQGEPTQEKGYFSGYFFLRDTLTYGKQLLGFWKLRINPVSSFLRILYQPLVVIYLVISIQPILHIGSAKTKKYFKNILSESIDSISLFPIFFENVTVKKRFLSFDHSIIVNWWTKPIRSFGTRFT